MTQSGAYALEQSLKAHLVRLMTVPAVMRVVADEVETRTHAMSMDRLQDGRDVGVGVVFTGDERRLLPAADAEERQSAGQQGQRRRFRNRLHVVVALNPQVVHK